MNTDAHGSPPHRVVSVSAMKTGWGVVPSVCIGVHLWFLLAVGGVVFAQSADIVATVNGAPISGKAVNDVVKSLIATRQPPPSSEEIGQLSDAALESLIDLELLYQAAQREQIHVSDEEVQADIARSKARVGGEK